MTPKRGEANEVSLEISPVCYLETVSRLQCRQEIQGGAGGGPDLKRWSWETEEEAKLIRVCKAELWGAESCTESSRDLQGSRASRGVWIRTCLCRDNRRPGKEPLKGAEGRILRAHTARGRVLLSPARVENLIHQGASDPGCRRFLLP